MVGTRTSQIISALPEVQSKRLYEIFLAQRPLVNELIEHSGESTVAEYVAAYYRSKLQSPQSTRQQEFLDTFAHYARNYVDETIVAGAVTQLQKYYSVSTADHHAPLFPSTAFQANVLIAASYEQVADPLLRYIIVLGCSSVSLNHCDFPRGLQYHAVRAHELVTEHLSIFPSKGQMWPVAVTPAFTAAQVKAAIHQVETKMHNGDIVTKLGERLRELLITYYLDPSVLAAPNYVAQLSKLNLALWPTVQPLANTTDLLYLDEEGLVTQLLLQHHMTAPTALHHLLFDHDVRQRLLPQLAAAMGAHLHQQSTGTDLFWAISSHSHHRVPLSIRGNALVSVMPSETIHIELTPLAIAAALRENRILPNLMLCYTVLSLYYQLNCTGGFNQMSYLTAMQTTYGASQVDAAFQAATTTAMHYGLASAFGVWQTEAVTISGMDVWLYGNAEFNTAWQQALNRVTVHQAVQWLAPAICRYLPDDMQVDYDKVALTKFTTTDSIERSFNQPAVLPLSN